MRSSWTHPDLAATCYLGSADERGDGRFEPLSEIEARFLIESWASRPLGRESLRQALLDVGAIAADAADGWSAGELVAEGRVRLLRGPPFGGAGGAGPSRPAGEPAPAPAEPIEVRHWIQIVVVDDDDLPLPNVAVELVLADESVVRSRTSESGVVLLPSVPEGTCKLSLPELDAKAWKRLG
jgi:hypothetical protein